jgi:acyl-CoA hydrolase
VSGEPPAPKRWRDSYTVTTQLVFPEHANALGKAFGGQVMAWLDMAGGICSMRHASGTTVTASVDDLQFQRTIAVGDTVIVEARVNGTFRSSMEVEVTIDGQNVVTGERWRCTEALFTFVAIDADSRPRPVSALALETDDDRKRQSAASARRDARLQRRKPGG